MTDTNLTPAEPADQPDPFAEIANELRVAAAGIETLIGSGLPKPGHFNLNIQPGTLGDDDSTAVAVDALGLALVGRRGEVRPMSNGDYHYDMGGQVQSGPISFSIYQSVSAEWAVKREAAAVLAEREAELEKLRAEVAELRAAAAPIAKPGFVDGPCEDPDCPNASWPHFASSDLAAPDPSGMSYTRADTDADDPTPVSPARVPLHTGGVVDGGQLVDEPVTWHYETTGWTGGDSGSGVACACGVQFDGFDSLKAAGDELRRHIAAPVSEARA